jgi:hypothetical protein
MAFLLGELMGLSCLCESDQFVDIHKASANHAAICLWRV